MKTLPAILVLIICFSSCRVSKDLSSSLEKENKAYKDSITSLTKVIMRKDEEKQRAVEDAKKASIIFSAPCPSSEELKALRVKLDSAGKVILDQFQKDNQQTGKIKSLENKLKVNADGSFELIGQIQSVNLDLLNRTIESTRLKQENDSLKAVSKYLLSSLATEKMTKSKHKTSKPAFGGYILVGFICLIIGVLLRHFIGKINPLKLNIMKSLLSMLLIGSLLFLESCGGKFKDGTSVFAEGLWLVPTVLLVGGSILIGVAYLQSKSNSERQRAGGGYDQNLGNIKITKLKRFWGGLILTILGLAAWIGINYFRA